jgi:hypothetical protein
VGNAIPAWSSSLRSILAELVHRTGVVSHRLRRAGLGYIGDAVVVGTKRAIAIIEHAVLKNGG